MNLRRIFANAIARRVAYVVVAIALAWLGVGDARAQSNTCPSLESGCSIAQAYSSCKAGEASLPPDRMVVPGMECKLPTQGVVNNWQFRHCAVNQFGNCQSTGQHNSVHMFVTGCPPGQTFDQDQGVCNEPCSSTGPALNSGFTIAANGGSGACPTSSCSTSPGGRMCVYSGTSADTITVDQKRYCSLAGFAPTGASCSGNNPTPEAPPEEPPPPDADGDGSSDPNDNSPNNPGESGDGSGQDDSTACGGQGQPACAEDGSNAGSGNGNTSGGGGNCQTPPSSSGDAILAQIAFQTWATRCALEGNANEGDGTGDGPGEGDGEQPDWTKGNAPDPATDDTDYVADQSDFDLPVSTDMLDQENIFGAASCPNFTIRVWTATVNSAEWDHWCRLVAILRGFILIFGAFTAIQILLGKW